MVGLGGERFPQHRLRCAAGQIARAAGTVTKAADEAGDRGVVVASASEEASTNVQTVASAAEELTASINEISRQLQQSAQIAQQAVEGANRSSSIIADLAQGVQEIGKVVELIDGVASQTNLLALNATIEAARPGKQRKALPWWPRGEVSGYPDRQGHRRYCAAD